MGVERTRSTAQATAEGLRVFVAGIPWKLDEDDIRRDFGECGVVEDLFLLRDEGGKSKGRAYITYQDKEAVDAALAYNETDYGGRKIFVKVAEPRKKDLEKAAQAQAPKKAAKEAPAGKDFPDQKPEGCRSLCLKNIGNATDAHVRKFLDGCAMQSVRIVTDRETGLPRGIAFVDFKHPSDVDRAMEKNGQQLKGSAVEMRYEAPRERPRPEGCMSVAIKKLPAQAQEADVRRLFNGLKSLKDVRVIMNKEKECTGLAFADFASSRDVEAAVQRDGMKVKGQVAFICYETKSKKENPEADARRKKIEERKQRQQERRQKRAEEAAAAPAEAGANADEVEDDEEAPTEGGDAGKKARARRLEKRKNERARKKEKFKQAKALEKGDLPAAVAAAAEEEGDGAAATDPLAKRRKKQASADGTAPQPSKKRRKASAAAAAPADAADGAGSGEAGGADGAEVGKRKEPRKTKQRNAAV